MNIPKFRAYIKATGEIYQVDALDIHYKYIKVMSNILDCRIIIYNFDEDEIELMQCTGIKDIKEKEIYEGDIIQYFSPIIDKKPIKNSVYYRHGSYRCLQSGAFGPIDIQTVFQCFMNVEVIGNLYQNPELLEDK